MDIPAQVIWTVMFLVGIVVVIAIIGYLSFSGGASRILEHVLGFLR